MTMTMITSTMLLCFAGYIVIGYLNVLLESYLDEQVPSFDDAITIMVIWPVLWMFLIVGFVCWVFSVWIPRLCAGKNKK